MERNKATSKFQKELNSGAVSIVLLGLMRQERRAMYGYEIAKQLESRAEHGLPMNQGALYPVLRSLEKQGLLSSEVKPSASGPPRKYYKITRDGRTALRLWTETWRNTKEFVDSFLEPNDDVSPGRSRSKVSRSP